MLRATTILGRSGIFNSCKYNAVGFPQKIRTAGSSNTQECEREPPNPPTDDCPPKTRCLMDFYPIPCGSWQEDYDRKNALYHRQLMVAAGVLVVTVIVVNKVGWVKGYPEITLF